MRLLPTDSSEIRRVRVLVVEDEAIVARDLAHTLESLGHSVAIAGTADEALAEADTAPPDIALLDIRIRGERDGIETAETLRKRFGMPVIFLSAFADDATVARAKRVEPYGYLVKPVEADDLKLAVEVSLYRHRAERRLQARERWYATTLRSLRDAVVGADAAGDVVFVNTAAETLLGVSFDDAVGRRASALVDVDHPSHQADDSPLRVALHRKETVRVREATLASATGPRTVDLSASPVIDEGETLGAVLVFQDVTEEARVRKQLELADRLSSLGTMAAGVAHEVNNPLAVIVANADYISDELGKLRDAHAEVADAMAEPAQALAELQSAATRIMRIVGDLRVFSRPPERGSMEARVRAAVDWAVRATQHEVRHRARVSVDVDAALPAVRGDEARLGQVFVNLLINAAHAIPPGRASENEISIMARFADGERVLVEVRDTGCGMPSDVAKRVFEPFFTTKPVGVGTGLGLSIGHGIVSAFGGSMEVESEVGQGTTFRIHLPVARDVTPTGEGRRHTSGPLPGGRVLVVDDEDLVREAVRRMLRHYVVATASSARDALALLEAGETYDALVCDVMMPGMGGVDFYETLAERDPEAARRVVFVTGGALTARDGEFLKSVPNPTVEKPFEPSALRRAIESVRRKDATTARTP
jgi:PAS domain S-box-containing protein